MAFATTNLNYSPLGVRSKLEGDWTGLQGDASGTVSVSGGRIYEASFSVQSSTGPSQTGNVGFSVSGPSSGLMTITVYNHEDVTAGRFHIIYG